MKNKVLIIIVLAAFACAGIWQANRADNNADLSELATSNVEALAIRDDDKTGCWYNYGDRDCNTIKGSLHCACI